MAEPPTTGNLLDRESSAAFVPKQDEQGNEEHGEHSAPRDQACGVPLRETTHAQPEARPPGFDGFTMEINSDT